MVDSTLEIVDAYKRKIIDLEHQVLLKPTMAAVRQREYAVGSNVKGAPRTERSLSYVQYTLSLATSFFTNAHSVQSELWSTPFVGTTPTEPPPFTIPMNSMRGGRPRAT